MLAAGNRLRRRQDFATTVRRGRRAGRPLLVVHMYVTDLATTGDSDLRRAVGSGSPVSGTAPRVGFVVGRSVGGAVVRNTVRRRLRHLIKDRIPLLPADARLVVRALPAAGSAPSSSLAADLDAALERLLGRNAAATGIRPEPAEEAGMGGTL